MVDTGFSVPAEKHARISKMYGHPDIALNGFNRIIEAWTAGFNERIDDVETTYPTTSPTFARGGHGLFSTASDYLRFAQMLLNRGELDGARILAPKIVDLMHMNHVPAALLPYGINGIPSMGYGFGLGSRVLLNVAETAMPWVGRRVRLGRRRQDLLLGRSKGAAGRRADVAVYDELRAARQGAPGAGLPGAGRLARGRSG